MLNFDKVKDTGKTKVYLVHGNPLLASLGSVKWYAPWRRYCFYPAPETLFDAVCMTEIIEFIGKLMEERKQGV